MIKERVGVIVSDSMNKTRVVLIERTVRHPKYRKTMKIRKKFYAHDELNSTKVGQTVKIQETRPISRFKRWRISAVVTE